MLEPLLTIAAILAVFALVYFFARNFALRRKLTCPRDQKEVDVEMVCRGTPEKPIPLKVKSCTAFPDPRQVECDEECVRQAV